MKVAIRSLDVAVIILVVGQILATTDKDFAKMRIPCMERNNISEDEFTAISKKKDMEEIDMKFKCFTYCIADEMGYLDEVGKISVPRLEEEPEMTEEALTKIMECRAEHDMEDEPCEYVFKMTICVMGLMLKDHDV